MNNIDITVELYHFFSIILQKHPSFLETMYPDFTQLILNRAINLLGKPERLLESAAGQFIVSDHYLLKILTLRFHSLRPKKATS